MTTQKKRRKKKKWKKKKKIKENKKERKKKESSKEEQLFQTPFPEDKLIASHLSEKMLEWSGGVKLQGIGIVHSFELLRGGQKKLLRVCLLHFKDWVKKENVKEIYTDVEKIRLKILFLDLDYENEPWNFFQRDFGEGRMFEGIYKMKQLREENQNNQNKKNKSESHIEKTLDQCKTKMLYSFETYLALNSSVVSKFFEDSQTRFKDIISNIGKEHQIDKQEITKFYEDKIQKDKKEITLYYDKKIQKEKQDMTTYYEERIKKEKQEISNYYEKKIENLKRNYSSIEKIDYPNTQVFSQKQREFMKGIEELSPESILKRFVESWEPWIRGEEEEDNFL